jgi:hypothetical protein
VVNERPLSYTQGLFRLRQREGYTGDANDAAGYWRFRNCMVNGRAGAPAPVGACLEAFDIGGDGGVGLDDFTVFQNSYTGAR